MCPLSVVCVHSLYLSTVRFPTHTTLSSTQSMPSLCWSIQVYSCVSTVSGVCPQSVYVHCSLSLTHYFSLTVNAFTLLAHSCVSAVSVCVSTVSVVCPLSLMCVHCQCCVSTLCSVSTVSVVCPVSVVCVHCQCCVSTVCICLLFTFSHTLSH